MKLHFEPNLDYQLAAIESVCSLFRGQEICRTEFTVTQGFGGGQIALAGLENDLGIGNRLSLLDDELLANLNEVQLRNGLNPSDKRESGDFTADNLVSDHLTRRNNCRIRPDDEHNEES
jgi:type III restriction enzyme